MKTLTIAPLQKFSDYHRSYAKIIVTAMLVALADFLFFDYSIGITFSLFVLCLGLGIAAANALGLDLKTLSKGTVILLIALLPSLETFNFLSGTIAIVGIIAFALIVHQKLRDGIVSGLREGLRFIYPLPMRFLFDGGKWFKDIKVQIPGMADRISLSAWIVPIVFSLGFLYLFSLGNPLIETWLAKIDIVQWISNINFDRLFFWLVATAFCWPFIHLKLGKRFAPKKTPATKTKKTQKKNDLFGEAAIFNSLLLFNILFAVQTMLDATYLWGGMALPDGMSHATYAHRGAYPLIITALLAAGFVLFATRPGSAAEDSPRIKGLILLWIGQNIVLVMSSVLRLNLYIEAFSLTYLRVAALIWMALVFTGLVLIIVKFALGRSNGWLITTNIAALGMVLYATSLTNLPGIIADYNVSVAIGNKDKILDLDYLFGLGSSALPAIDRAFNNKKRLENKYSRTPYYSAYKPNRRREKMVEKVLKLSKNWRLWSYRRVRILKQIETVGPVIFPFHKP